MSLHRFRLALVLLVLILPLVLFKSIDISNAKMYALFFSVVILWFTELLPLAVTGLLVPILGVLYGLGETREVFASFGNQILFLFIGAFLLGKAMQKHGWDKRLAYTLLSLRIGEGSCLRLTALFALMCWCLSMWITNTATCAIMTPIALGLCGSIGEKFSDPKSQQNFTIKLLLTCAFASSMGGIATPVGTVPNVLALEFLSEQGVNLTFIDWVCVGMPVSVVMLFLLLVLLEIMCPTEKLQLEGVSTYFREKKESLGKVQAAEWQVAGCFTAAVVLWVAPGLVPLVWPNHPAGLKLENMLPMGSAAILASVPLFVLPTRGENVWQMNLEWKDASEIDWGTILLFGGGLCLGSLMTSSGFAQEMGSIVFGWQKEIYLLVGFSAILFSVLMSEFSSNTASAAVVLPLLMASMPSLASSELTGLVVAAAIGASFGFMLPVSTPPNAIVYGTGRVPLRRMIRIGVVFDALGVLVVGVMCLLLLRSLN